MAGLGYRDGDFHLEFVVAELLDGVAAIDERPPGAFVVLASHVASPLAVPLPVV
jgi:hypothetical protein